MGKSHGAVRATQDLQVMLRKVRWWGEEWGNGDGSVGDDTVSQMGWLMANI